MPSRELAARINERWPMHPISQNYRGEVAQRWRFDDGGGEVGFISSVSQPFCGACSRARLSSEGKFYTCLFATHGLDLRAPLRAGADDAELLQIDSRHLARPYRSLQRAARGAAPHRARRPRRSRCTTSAAESMTFSHLDADQRPTMVDVSDKAATKRTRHRRGARAVSRRPSPRRCATTACARPRVRYSTRRSSPASWARSAPTSSFRSATRSDSRTAASPSIWKATRRSFAAR